ncbi:MAG: hypothetical protein J0G29_05830, partial [Alphaproteobacteria bacterium]|nr:hypothetical protein [Alphaproteobacteria bacterium]
MARFGKFLRFFVALNYLFTSTLECGAASDFSGILIPDASWLPIYERPSLAKLNQNETYYSYDWIMTSPPNTTYNGAHLEGYTAPANATFFTQPPGQVCWPDVSVSILKVSDQWQPRLRLMECDGLMMTIDPSDGGNGASGLISLNHEDPTIGLVLRGSLNATSGLLRLQHLAFDPYKLSENNTASITLPPNLNPTASLLKTVSVTAPFVHVNGNIVTDASLVVDATSPDPGEDGAAPLNVTPESRVYSASISATSEGSMSLAGEHRALFGSMSYKAGRDILAPPSSSIMGPYSIDFVTNGEMKVDADAKMMAIAEISVMASTLVNSGEVIGLRGLNTQLENSLQNKGKLGSSQTVQINARNLTLHNGAIYQGNINIPDQILAFLYNYFQLGQMMIRSIAEIGVFIAIQEQFQMLGQAKVQALGRVSILAHDIDLQSQQFANTINYPVIESLNSDVTLMAKGGHYYSNIATVLSSQGSAEVYGHDVQVTGIPFNLHPLLSVAYRDLNAKKSIIIRADGNATITDGFIVSSDLLSIYAKNLNITTTPFTPQLTDSTRKEYWSQFVSLAGYRTESNVNEQALTERVAITKSDLASTVPPQLTISNINLVGSQKGNGALYNALEGGKVILRAKGRYFQQLANIRGEELVEIEGTQGVSVIPAYVYDYARTQLAHGFDEVETTMALVSAINAGMLLVDSSAATTLVGAYVRAAQGKIDGASIHILPAEERLKKFHYWHEAVCSKRAFGGCRKHGYEHDEHREERTILRPSDIMIGDLTTGSAKTQLIDIVAARMVLDAWEAMSKDITIFAGKELVYVDEFNQVVKTGAWFHGGKLKIHEDKRQRSVSMDEIVVPTIINIGQAFFGVFQGKYHLLGTRVDAPTAQVVVYAKEGLKLEAMGEAHYRMVSIMERSSGIGIRANFDELSIRMSHQHASGRHWEEWVSAVASAMEAGTLTLVTGGPLEVIGSDATGH